MNMQQLAGLDVSRTEVAEARKLAEAVELLATCRGEMKEFAYENLLDEWRGGCPQLKQYVNEKRRSRRRG